MAYLLDTNVLITAKNFHYGFDFCPGFWAWLVDQHRSGLVYSVERVYGEIKQGNDELADWVDQLPDSFFLKPDEDTRPHFVSVGQWISGRGYPEAQRARFSSAADYFLVGQALQSGSTLVTYEAYQKQKGKIQIPEVCCGLNVECLPPHEMLRRERARFILGAQA